MKKQKGVLLWNTVYYWSSCYCCCLGYGIQEDMRKLTEAIPILRSYLTQLKIIDALILQRHVGLSSIIGYKMHILLSQWWIYLLCHYHFYTW